MDPVTGAFDGAQHEGRERLAYFGQVLRSNIPRVAAGYEQRLPKEQKAQAETQQQIRLEREREREKSLVRRTT